MTATSGDATPRTTDPTQAERIPAQPWVRAGLVVMALGGILVGGWATLSPESFYRDFPGLGRHWVSVDGPYNEHLVRDVGALNLALAVITAVAAWRLGPTMIRAVCTSWLVYSVPHTIYHATHGSALERTDFVFEMVSLSTNLLVPAAILVILTMASPSRR